MSSSQSSLLLPRRGLNAITSGWQKLIARVFDPYRPEQHYMRGPGPKWRAKHALHAARAG